MIAWSLFVIDPERWFPAVPADPVPDTAVLWRPHPSARGGRCTKILKMLRLLYFLRRAGHTRTLLRQFKHLLRPNNGRLSNTGQHLAETSFWHYSYLSMSREALNVALSRVATYNKCRDICYMSQAQLSFFVSSGLSRKIIKKIVITLLLYMKDLQWKLS